MQKVIAPGSTSLLPAFAISEEASMFELSKILLYALAGAFGGSAAWAFILSVSSGSTSGLLTEALLGALAGLFISGFLWSRESMTGRQIKVAIKRAGLGAVAGFIGGAVGAVLGSTVFTTLGRIVADAGGFKASLGVALAVALGWAILGAVTGLAGGVMIRSRERALYGLFGGALGGLVGGLLFYELSTTSIWSNLAGLALLGMSIGASISLVEEAFVSAKLKVVKGRHLGREFPLLKDTNLVGRDDRSDICLSGAEGVGLQHAAIKRLNGHFSIETDKDGAVYVNQKLTRSSRLSDGDVIRVGSILLLFSAIKKAAADAVVILSLGIVLSGLTASISHAAEPATVRISQFDLTGFPAVKAYVSVLDAEDRPVRGLTREGVTLLENDHPVDIDSMKMYGMDGTPGPVSFSIVLDRSGSMEGEKITRAKESVLRFFSLMEPGDRASFITFSDTVEQIEPLTGDIERLKRETEVVKAGGHTALFDAIAAGVASVRDEPGRRAVIVLTDGKANRGALDIDQAVAAAIKANVSVYAIGLGEDVRAARLAGIAEQSGGVYFFTPTAVGLAEIYQTISKRIRNEYVITYRADKRGDYLRRVSLSLKNGKQAARAYFQPESSLFGAAAAAPGWAYGVSIGCFLALVGISFRRIERRYKTGHLIVVRGQGTKKDIDIDANVNIGRDERNELGLFRDSGIEQLHAAVRKDSGQYVIEDRGSRSGTFVNKKKVMGSQVLEDGDIINLGHTTIVFTKESKRICAGCGSPVGQTAKFCSRCGVKAA
jgi:VWFA-related protein